MSVKIKINCSILFIQGIEWGQILLKYLHYNDVFHRNTGVWEVIPPYLEIKMYEMDWEKFWKLTGPFLLQGLKIGIFVNRFQTSLVNMAQNTSPLFYS